MNPFQLLVNFTAEYWYKMFVFLGVILMFAGLFFPTQTISNGSLLTIGLGTFLFGTGEWMNHPYTEAIDPFLRYKLHGHPRRNSLGGVLIRAAGVIVLALGLIAAVYSAFA